jgi:hypothetical protein
MTSNQSNSFNCWQCEKSDHTAKNCRSLSRNSQSQRFEIRVELVHEKEMIVTMSSCNLKNDLFDDDLVIESCILDDENQYLVKAMIDNDCIDYSFVNSVIVSNICETLKISSMKLNKSRKIKKYDERMSDSIIHVIYSRMIIRDHVESSIFLLITKLSQHDIILEKSWMRKHEMSYHDHSDDIFFLSDHCSHLETLERTFSILSTQIKEMLQESRKKINDFKLTRILKRCDDPTILLPLPSIWHCALTKQVSESKRMLDRVQETTLYVVNFFHLFTFFLRLDFFSLESHIIASLFWFWWCLTLNLVSSSCYSEYDI